MKYKPIKYYCLYIIITLMISFWGPAKYIDYDKTSVFLFMIAFMLVITLGYYIGSIYKITENKINLNELKCSKRRKLVNILPLLRIAIIISTVGVSIEIFEAFIRNPEAFSLAKIGNNYFEIRQYLALSSGYSVGILIRFFTGFFRNLIMTVGIYNYGRLSKKYRIGIILFYVLTVIINSIVYGTQKMLGDMFIFAVIVAVLKMSEISPKKRKKIYKNVLIITIVFLVYVVINQVQRYDSIGVNVFNYGDRTINGVYYDPEHIIFKILGYKYGFGLAAILTGYMTAGYYGLSLCLKLPFVWTYGIGSSYILSMALERFLGLPNMYYSTYLYRMENTFGRLGADAWNTIFPWLASDFTFIGALLFFLPVGIVYAISWRETLIYKNPVSLLMFATISLGLIFVPANNQLFNGIDGFIATWLTIIYWILNHKKYNLVEIADNE